MRKLILFVWQLPQHILGLLLLLIFRKKLNTVIPYKGDSAVYWMNNIGWGISLGNIIILDSLYKYETVMHEYGHSIQSKIWGPLYLLVIGLPSITMNILSIFGIMDPKRYYLRWPENEADRLGGVDRGQNKA